MFDPLLTRKVRFHRAIRTPTAIRQRWIDAIMHASLLAFPFLITSLGAASATAPVSAGDQVLLLVDVQNDFWGPQMEKQNPAFESNVAELLKTCRAGDIEVVHVHTEFDRELKERPESFARIFGKEQLAVENTPGAAPLAVAKPKGREKVFYKQSFGSFTNEDLEKYLEQRRPREILVAGLTTEMCVLSTAMGAMDRGHVVRLVSDCCGAPRPEVTRFVMARYGFLFRPINHNELAPKTKSKAESKSRTQLIAPY